MLKAIDLNDPFLSPHSQSKKNCVNPIGFCIKYPFNIRGLKILDL